jgi:hypothetical protein
LAQAGESEYPNGKLPELQAVKEMVASVQNIQT